MVELDHATVYRGGVTASYLTIETHDCSFTADSGTLDFRFRLASKGGGQTEVLLQIGVEDLPTLLLNVAENMPENASVFADCAAHASKKNLELLNWSQEHQQTNRESKRSN